MHLFASTSRSTRVVVSIAGALLLTVTACSSSSSPAKKSAVSSAPSGTADFPTVTGGYGVKPVLSFPNANPSAALQAKVLSEGSGPVVVKGQLMVADYLGQIWRGKVFDNSYDRKTPLGTAIGLGQVIPGWDKKLVGQHVGSRVLLVIPPADGYGSAGSSGAGIKGTDTLAFVIDIVSTYSKTDVGDKSAVPQNVVTAPVTVSGALGTRPKITVVKGTALPKAVKTVVLAKSKGAPVKAGVVVLQYEAVSYTGVVAGSTYLQGQPRAVPVGAKGQPGAFDGVIGVPIGSRVLITAPVNDNAGKAVGLAIVADVIAQTGPAKA